MGRRVRIERPGDEWAEVVGIVGPVHLAQVDDPPRASVLVHQAQVRPSYGSVAVATAGPPYDALPMLQRIVGALDPDLPLFLVFSLRDAIDYGHANVRISARIVGWLGVCALLVAVAGLYALVAVRVAERTREIGVRRAVGASGIAVARAVCRQVVLPLAVGLSGGLLLAWPGARSLVAIEPTVIALGPESFAWAGALQVAAVVAALAAPLARALTIDPVVALRCE